MLSILLILLTTTTKVQSTENLVEVDFRTGWDNSDGSLHGALIFKLAPTYKTYWRNPGQFGIPPKFNWEKSINIREIKFFWPAPKVFDRDSIPVLGYENELVLPIQIFKHDLNKPVILNIEISYGICSDICILKSETIFKILEVNKNIRTNEIIKKALEHLPKRNSNPKEVSHSCQLINEGTHLMVEHTLKFVSKPKHDPIAIFEYLPHRHILPSEPIEYTETKFFLKASLERVKHLYGALERNKINTFFLYDDTAFEITGCYQTF